MNIAANKKLPPAGGPDIPTGPPARLISLLLALITVLLYLPAGFHDFIFFDDPSYVTGNAMVANGLSWAGLKWAFIGWHASNWHPLTWLSHQLDCQLFGLNAGAHHLVNVLFHAASTVLLFRLWWRLTGALWPSAVVAALFAWHPLHVESVAWVSERKDVLSTFFGLLALLAYARYAHESNVPSPASKAPNSNGRLFYWLSLLAFAQGLLAKPMLVTLPFVLLLLDYWPLRRFTAQGRLLMEGASLIREKWPFFLLTAASCLLTFLAQRQAAVVSLHQLAFGLRLENALVACAGYMGKILWPVNLSIFYPLPEHFPAGQVLVSAAVLVTASLLAWRWRWSHRYFLVGWLWFLGMLVPVIGLVQVGDQAMADRYTYLPAVGLFVAAVFGIAGVWVRWKIPARPAALAAVVILGACALGTEHQLTFWRDTETLFTHALAVTRHNGPAHMMLGVAAEQQGRTDEALSQYQAALAEDASLVVRVAGWEARPLAAQVQLLLGQAAEQKGRAAEAIGCYHAALRLDGNLVEAHNNLGNLLEGQGRPDEALAEYQAAERLRPETPLVHENLGTQLAQIGRFDEAAKEYQEAARLAPADPQPYYLTGKAWLRRGQSGQAVAAFQAALQLNPDDVPSLVYLAQILAADEAPQIRNGAVAVTLAEHASQLDGGTQPFVLSTLAMAYAEAGRFADARQTAQTALKLASGGNPEIISKLQSQLQLYEANQPFRETFTNESAR